MHTVTIENRYDFRISNHVVNPKEWDNFVASIPGGHFEQTTFWAHARSYYGWRSNIFMLEENGEIIAGTLMLYRSIPYLGKIGYISFGPCLKYKSEKIFEILLKEIKRVMASDHYIYLVISLSYYDLFAVPLLQKNGFKTLLNELPPKGLMEATLLLDLGKTLEELLSDMKKKRRHNINNALKQGFHIREGAREDMEMFYELMLMTCKRRNATPTPAGKDFYIRLWDSFRASGGLRLSIVDYNGKVVCAGLDFAYGDIYRAWKSGWTGEYAHLHPNEFLEWSTIQWAKSNGFRYYDFESIDKNVALDIQENTKFSPVSGEYKTNPFYGPTIYKMGYGGIILELPGAYSYFSNKYIYTIVSLACQLISRQKWIKNLINRGWEKIKSNKN